VCLWWWVQELMAEIDEADKKLLTELAHAYKGPHVPLRQSLVDAFTAARHQQQQAQQGGPQGQPPPQQHQPPQPQPAQLQPPPPPRRQQQQQQQQVIDLRPQAVVPPQQAFGAARTPPLAGMAPPPHAAQDLPHLMLPQQHQHPHQQLHQAPGQQHLLQPPQPAAPGAAGDQPRVRRKLTAKPAAQAKAAPTTAAVTILNDVVQVGGQGGLQVGEGRMVLKIGGGGVCACLLGC